MTRMLSSYWIQTASGVEFDLAHPRPEDVRIEDIAHALSQICRFTGHTRSFYSVAQHSVLVSLAVSPAHQFEGLLHDATEAYVGDVASPLKRMIPAYGRIEAAVRHAIADRFGLALELPEEVKQADAALLVLEARALMPEHGWHREMPVNTDLYARLPTITPWSPEKALGLFLDQFERLGGHTR